MIKNDAIIIGSGPAGITAAIYAARAGLNVKVFEKQQPGGQLWLSEKIENYPGFIEPVESFKLADMMHKQMQKFDVDYSNNEVVSLQKKDDVIEISDSGGNTVQTIGALIASGASMKEIGVKGEKEFTGRGVSYCAVCDGPLFKGKTIAVVGGGNTACEEAVFLSKFADKVYLIHRRDRLRAVGRIADRVIENEKIEMVLNEEIAEIKGDDKVSGIKLNDKSELEVDGVFIFIGLTPNTGFVSKSVETENGFIITDENLKTSVDGIYSAGDCRKNAFRQVVTACGEGALASDNMRKYIEKMKGQSYDW